MKSIISLFVICLFVLQSCSINSEITYHKDAASTIIMDFDMKDAMEMMKSMVSDSAKNDKKEIAELEKLPKVWTSFYEMQKKEGKLKTDNPDSIKIMKKIFMKSNFDNKDIIGFSVKMDHFSKDDYNTMRNFSKNDKLPIDQMAFNSWDGKTLIIDVDNFSLKGFKDILAGKGLPDNEEGLSEENLKKTAGMMKMMYKKIGTTLRFENKIKSIKGKHEWVTKVDDHSIKIDFDLDSMFDDSKPPLKNSDKRIIIVTE